MNPNRNCEDHHLVYFIVRAISCLVSIVVVFSCFLLALLCSPFRFLIGFYLSKKYNQSIEFVDGIHTLFSMDNVFAPLHIQSYQVFSGKIDVANLCQRINDRWLRKEDNLKFRRILKQEFGYYFWLANPNIDLENHIIKYEAAQPRNMKEFNAIASELATILPVERGILWQIFVMDLPIDFPGYKNGPKSILCLNFHHSLGDGIMLTRFVSDIFDNPSGNNFISAKPPMLFVDRVRYFAKMLITGPFLALKDVIVRERHHLLGSRLSGVKFVSFSSPMSLELIQKIAHNTDSNSDVVLTSCIVGGLRSYFLSEKMPVPSMVRFLRPMLLPGSPTIENNEININIKASFACYNLPINATTPLDRLKLTKEMTDDWDNNPSAYLSYLITLLCVNRIPGFVTSAMMNAIQTTGVIAHTNSVNESPKLFENELIQSLVSASATGISGIAITTISCNGFVTFGLKVDTNMISDQDKADKLIGFIITELFDLENDSQKYKK